MDKRLCTNWEQVSAVFDNVDETVDEGEVLKKKGSAGRLLLRASVGPPTAMNDLRLL